MTDGKQFFRRIIKSDIMKSIPIWTADGMDLGMNIKTGQVFGIQKAYG